MNLITISSLLDTAGFAFALFFLAAVLVALGFVAGVVYTAERLKPLKTPRQ